MSLNTHREIYKLFCSLSSSYRKILMVWKAGRALKKQECVLHPNTQAFSRRCLLADEHPFGRDLVLMQYFFFKHSLQRSWGRQCPSVVSSETRAVSNPAQDQYRYALVVTLTHTSGGELIPDAISFSRCPEVWQQIFLSFRCPVPLPATWTASVREVLAPYEKARWKGDGAVSTEIANLPQIWERQASGWQLGKRSVQSLNQNTLFSKGKHQFDHCHLPTLASTANFL